LTEIDIDTDSEYENEYEDDRDVDDEARVAARAGNNQQPIANSR
jgi:hypothetical protein